MSLQWVKTARHGGGVQRAHTVPYTIQRHYSNAEHTFNAIIIAKALCKDIDYKIRINHDECISAPIHIDVREDNIILYLLAHDLAESYTGDMPANVKKETAVKSLLDTIEKEWEDTHMPKEYAHELYEHEMWIAKMADSLELAMFCIDEYKMGNRHEVFTNMLIRVKVYIDEHMNQCPTLCYYFKTATEIQEELRLCV